MDSLSSRESTSRPLLLLLIIVLLEGDLRGVGRLLEDSSSGALDSVCPTGVENRWIGRLLEDSSSGALGLLEDPRVI